MTRAGLQPPPRAAPCCHRTSGHPVALSPRPVLLAICQPVHLPVRPSRIPAGTSSGPGTRSDTPTKTRTDDKVATPVATIRASPTTGSIHSHSPPSPQRCPHPCGWAVSSSRVPWTARGRVRFAATASSDRCTALPGPTRPPRSHPRPGAERDLAEAGATGTPARPANRHDPAPARHPGASGRRPRAPRMRHHPSSPRLVRTDQQDFPLKPGRPTALPPL